MARTPGSNTVFTIDFKNGSLTPEKGSITNSGATTTNIGYRYALEVNQSKAIQISSPTVYTKSVGNYFYSEWIKNTGSSSECRFMEINNGYSQMRITSSSSQIGAGVIEANKGTTYLYRTSATYNTWHLVCINYKGNGTSDVYIDGVFKGTATNTTTGSGSTGTGQWIGGNVAQYSSGAGIGQIGQIIIENKLRTATEIQNYYNDTARQYGLASKPTILYGSSPINKIYYGSTAIKAVYYGSTKIRPSSRLPSAYQEVEYIESSGSQYINTGYTPSSNYTRVVADITPQTGSGSWSVFFGMSNSSSSLYSLHIGGGTWYINVGSTANKSIATFTSGSRINVDYAANGGAYTLKLGISTYTGSYGGNITQSTRNMYIFAFDEQGSTTWLAKMRVYSFKIYSSATTLVRDFVPCYRKSDNVIGMYDLITNTFYTNSGSGTFTKGANVN